MNSPLDLGFRLTAGMQIALASDPHTPVGTVEKEALIKLADIVDVTINGKKEIVFAVNGCEWYDPKDARNRIHVVPYISTGTVQEDHSRLIGETKTMNKFLHYRVQQEELASDNNPNGVSSRGGATVAYTKTEEGTIAYATAYCSPRDNYSRKTGRLKASCHLEAKSQRYEDTGLTDSSEFITAMDSEMFSRAGYTRVG